MGPTEFDAGLIDPPCLDESTDDPGTHRHVHCEPQERPEQPLVADHREQRELLTDDI